jgi:hypothetical protein
MGRATARRGVVAVLLLVLLLLLLVGGRLLQGGRRRQQVHGPSGLVMGGRDGRRRHQRRLGDVAGVVGFGAGRGRG